MLELVEYDTEVFRDVSLTDTDRCLLTDTPLRSRLRVRELSGGRVEVTAYQYVGTVRLESCEIRVLPKYLGTDLDVLRMLDHAWGGARDLLPTAQSFVGGAPNLRDLVCLMVTEHGERLLRHGVRRDYLTVEDDLRVVRGRLLPDRQVLRHHSRLDRLACRFEEHDADITDNRLCAAALAVAARTARSPEVRARAQRRGPVRPARADLAGRRPGGDVGLEYHRHNEHYRPAHLWSGLLLSGGGMDDLFTSGPLASQAFLVDMNRLFEAFTTRLLEQGSAGSGLRVDSQSRQSKVLYDEHTGLSHGTVRPDVLISGQRADGPYRLPVDVKYKLYDEKRLSPGDLYQAFFYAHALGRLGDAEAPVCVLLHPGEASADRGRVAVRTIDGPVTARVRSVPLDLRSVLAELAGPEPHRVPARLFQDVLP